VSVPTSHDPRAAVDSWEEEGASAAPTQSARPVPAGSTAVGPASPVRSGGDVWRAEPLLEVRNVRAGYGAVEVLHGVDLAVRPGQVVGMLGPNGAGKTTVLRTIAGLLLPSSGDVVIAGRRTNGVPAEDLARRGVCVIPEGGGIFANLTVGENLRMATHAGVSLATVEERAYFRFPSLKAHHKQTAGTLSGGEQRMLSLARALSTDPALLLVDELSTRLAPQIVERLYDLIRRVASDGVAILVIEQFAQTILEVADLAAVMIQGRIMMSGTPDEVRDGLADAYLGR
jgi:branched-chain amino acid transport system ATP-binding protein